MLYKTIIVSLNETGRVQELLEAAGSIARANDAHLIGLYVIPAVTVYPEVGMVAMPIVFEGIREAFKSKLDGVRSEFENFVKKNGLSGEWRGVDSAYPRLAESSIVHARRADLVVVSQAGGDAVSDVEPDLVERLVLETGRPVLAVPRKGTFRPRGDGFGEKVVAGVNGTRESSRAMFDALPFLQRAKEVRLVWVDPYRDREEAGDVPGAEEAAALARHGVKVTAEPMMTDGRDAGEALLMRAGDLGADLLVMGAYAHSRLREYVFGGATRHVLANMTVPVLMSH